MSVSANEQRAARIIEQVTPETPADAALREAFSGGNEIEAADKRTVAGLVFGYFRWIGWLDKNDSTARRVAAARELQARFNTSPDSFKAESLQARAVPSWIPEEMSPVPVDWLRQLQREPTLWIRAQAAFARSIPRALGHCVPADLAAFSSVERDDPTALRYDGPKDLFRTDEFRKGLFEIQDLASQLVGYACAPKPGETWWDACAGEGGKTLHLGDLMKNQGLIWCSDRSARRLASLRKRAARAQLFNYRAVNWNGGPFPPTKTRFDGVLVDAPCSGVGTWQRNPHARWTTSPEDVRELAELQLQLLDHTAPTVKPGGRLVYAVCTLTRSETTAVAEAFSARHPEFAPHPVYGGGSSRFLWPHELNANGMFVTAWKRVAA
jgi:16S rRNA (cytosine967-C5)-methyltransferase